jgi:hypothetical protein
MGPSLPNNPSLERFRRDARRLQRAAREGDAEALALLSRHHPAARPAPTERQRFRRDVKDVDAGTRPLLRNQSRQVAGAATNLENPVVTRADAFCHGLMRVPGSPGVDDIQ